LELILFILLVGLGVYFYVKDNSDWVEIYSADESSLKEVQLRIKYLKDRGIRPRLKHPGFGGFFPRNNPGEAGKIKIMVRTEEKETALDYLEKYSIERFQ